LIHDDSMSLWSVPFKDQYLSPIPSGPITFPQGVKGLDPPTPDLTVDLSLSAPRGRRLVYFILPSLNPDPASLMLEATGRPLTAGSRPTFFTKYRLVVTQDVADRHRMEVRVENLPSWILPWDYQHFLALKRIGRFEVGHLQASCVLGVGIRPISSNSPYHHLCLCTVATDAHGSPSISHSTEGGDASLTSNSISATMTVIGLSGFDFGAMEVCSASGRAAFSKRHAPEVKQSLYLHDYFTWDHMAT
jgi:hypothetical protein